MSRFCGAVEGRGRDVKPLSGYGVVACTATQGALRDPGLLEYYAFGVGRPTTSETKRAYAAKAVFRVNCHQIEQPRLCLT